MAEREENTTSMLRDALTRADLLRLELSMMRQKQQASSGRSSPTKIPRANGSGSSAGVGSGTSTSGARPWSIPAVPSSSPGTGIPKPGAARGSANGDAPQQGEKRDGKKTSPAPPAAATDAPAGRRAEPSSAATGGGGGRPQVSKQASLASSWGSGWSANASGVSPASTQHRAIPRTPASFSVLEAEHCRLLGNLSRLPAHQSRSRPALSAGSPSRPADAARQRYSSVRSSRLSAPSPAGSAGPAPSAPAGLGPPRRKSAVSVADLLATPWWEATSRASSAATSPAGSAAPSPRGGYAPSQGDDEADSGPPAAAGARDRTPDTAHELRGSIDVAKSQDGVWRPVEVVDASMPSPIRAAAPPVASEPEFRFQPPSRPGTRAGSRSPGPSRIVGPPASRAIASPPVGRPLAARAADATAAGAAARPTRPDAALTGGSPGTAARPPAHPRPGGSPYRYGDAGARAPGGPATGAPPPPGSSPPRPRPPLRAASASPSRLSGLPAAPPAASHAVSRPRVAAAPRARPGPSPPRAAAPFPPTAPLPPLAEPLPDLSAEAAEAELRAAFAPSRTLPRSPSRASAGGDGRDGREASAPTKLAEPAGGVRITDAAAEALEEASSPRLGSSQLRSSSTWYRKNSQGDGVGGPTPSPPPAEPGAEAQPPRRRRFTPPPRLRLPESLDQPAWRNLLRTPPNKVADRQAAEAARREREASEGRGAAPAAVARAAPAAPAAARRRGATATPEPAAARAWSDLQRRSPCASLLAALGGTGQVADDRALRASLARGLTLHKAWVPRAAASLVRRGLEAPPQAPLRGSVRLVRFQGGRGDGSATAVYGSGLFRVPTRFVIQRATVDSAPSRGGSGVLLETDRGLIRLRATSSGDHATLAFGLNALLGGSLEAVGPGEPDVRWAPGIALR